MTNEQAVAPAPLPRDPAIPPGLYKLHEAVPPHLISPLPKPTKHQNSEETRHMWTRCQLCGGFHHPQVAHLSYVGHAAATRLLFEADPLWDWEPLAYDARGLPMFDEEGGLWIRLTVCGKTRLGYGNANKKPVGADAGARVKEVIGDALRNAAMRFGLALELWSKADLNGDGGPPIDDGGDDDGPPAPPAPKAPASKSAKASAPAPASSGRPAKKAYPAESFEKNLRVWSETIQAGLKTSEEVILMVERNGTLTEQQKQKLRAFDVQKGKQ